jgi:hypothetical protein
VFVCSAALPPSLKLRRTAEALAKAVRAARARHGRPEESVNNLLWLPRSAFARSAPADRRSLGEGWSGGRSRPALVFHLKVEATRSICHRPERLPVQIDFAWGPGRARRVRRARGSRRGRQRSAPLLRLGSADRQRPVTMLQIMRPRTGVTPSVRNKPACSLRSSFVISVAPFVSVSVTSVHSDSPLPAPRSPARATATRRDRRCGCRWFARSESAGRQSESSARRAPTDRGCARRDRRTR